MREYMEKLKARGKWPAKPDLQRVTVTNAGHAPTLNEPEAAAVDDFIRRF